MEERSSWERKEMDSKTQSELKATDQIKEEREANKITVEHITSLSCFPMGVNIGHDS